MVVHFSGLVNEKCQSKKKEKDFIGSTLTTEKREDPCLSKNLGLGSVPFLKRI